MGDRTALVETFENLYRANIAEMVRLAFLVTGSVHVAEEVVHDSFIAVQQKWDKINNPRAYLRSAVVNRSRSHLRRLSIQRRAPIELPLPSYPEEIDETWALIQQLPTKQRAALALHYYLDLPIAEIAEVMGERPGTVKSLLHRGREALRKEMA